MMSRTMKILELAAKYNNEVKSPNGYNASCDFDSQNSNSYKINSEKNIYDFPSEENSPENVSNSVNSFDSSMTISSEVNILAENDVSTALKEDAADTKNLIMCSNAKLLQVTDLSTNDATEFSSIEKPNADIVCSYVLSEPESNSINFGASCGLVSQKSNSDKTNTDKNIYDFPSEENSLENATNSENIFDSLVTITSEINILAENGVCSTAAKADTKKLSMCSNEILQKVTELSTNEGILPNAEIVCSYLSRESDSESNSLNFVEMAAVVPHDTVNISLEDEPDDESVFYDSDMDPEYKPEFDSSFEELIIENDNKENENPYLQKEVVDEANTPVQKSKVSQSTETNKTNSLISKSTNERPSNDFPIEITTRKNYTDRRDFCFFCDKDVSHFARHLFTWHDTEIEVQRIQSLKTNSKERRNLLSQLRKKGNFLRNGSEEKLRPVKRVQVGDKSNRDDFLPCQFCLGFYKRKALYRHTKICNANPNLEKNTKRQAAQSNGQTTLLLHTTVKHCELLRAELFPRMRADDISFIAKKDTLICAYAYSYMKGRRSKGNIDLVRQNVRRLARLIKFARERNDKVKDLIDILQPELFHVIVECVNLIAGYNNDTESYESPTVALNFGTLLKKCCDLAVIHLLQKNNTEKQRDDVKTLKTLIESQWANEVSAQASTNLNQNKWNKQELLPLTSDLKIFNTFLKKLAGELYDALCKDEKCVQTYHKLKEVLYTQIILLNRRRPAEVAQLKVDTYKTINMQIDSAEENEFQNCLTETEKILLKTYSRIVVRGKRGRGVPILLSPDMRKHFEILLSKRNLFMSNKNDYLFHTSGQGFLDGTKILQKYAAISGLQRPKSITANRLRKHLATIAQLLQFSENDMEQLTKFMGHTLKTHCSAYRMSDNMYQTAKVSKLLLLMQDGGIEQFIGKSLDEIEFDLDPVLEDIDYFTENVEESDRALNEIICNTEEVESNESKKDEDKPEKTKKRRNLIRLNEQETKKKTKKCKKIDRQPWSGAEKKLLATYFKNHIEQKRAPGIQDVKKFVDNYPDIMKDRKWTSVKATVYNIYTGKLKVQN